MSTTQPTSRRGRIAQQRPGAARHPARLLVGVVAVGATAALGFQATAASPPTAALSTAPAGSTASASGGRFTALKPGTRYAWTASVDGIGRAAGSFQTAPPNLERPVRFVAFGDYGSGNDHEYAVGRVAAAQAPAFALTAGDNSYLAATAPLLDRNI